MYTIHWTLIGQGYKISRVSRCYAGTLAEAKREVMARKSSGRIIITAAYAGKLRMVYHATA